MCFEGRIRLTIHERMIESFFEYIWSDLPAQIAIDTRVIDEEIARDVLRICALCISHKNILGKEPQKSTKGIEKFVLLARLWLLVSLFLQEGINLRNTAPMPFLSQIRGQPGTHDVPHLFQ
jgi:hypothetical protein